MIVPEKNIQQDISPAHKTNMHLWADVLANLPDSYQEWFKEERSYLQERIAPNAKILEVGCGDGRSIFDCLPNTTDITGIDHGEKAVKDALDNFSSYPSVRILKAEANELPFNDEVFDYVICMTTFANFAEEKFIILDEMKRVLKKDGKIIISVFSDKALQERMEIYHKLGFNIKKVENGAVTLGTDEGDVISEQFSREQLEEVFQKAGLQIENMKTINIAHLCTLSPVG